MGWEKWKHCGESPYATHRAALGTVLKTTHPRIVAEFGIGLGSTPLLLEYAVWCGATYLGYENNFRYVAETVYELSKEQLAQANILLVADWDVAIKLVPEAVDMVFVDHWPPENRAVVLERLKDRARVLVTHDWQDEGCHWGDVATHFKYIKVDDRVTPTTAILSNVVDVTLLELL